MLFFAYFPISAFSRSKEPMSYVSHRDKKNSFVAIRCCCCFVVVVVVAVVVVVVAASTAQAFTSHCCSTTGSDKREMFDTC